MNLWRKLLVFILGTGYEYFTKDEKEVLKIAQSEIRKVNYGSIKPSEKRIIASENIKGRLKSAGIEIASHFIFYSIEKAVRELRK